MRNPLEEAAEKIGAAVDRAGEKWHDAIQAGLLQTTNAVRLRGARNRNISGTGLLWGGPGRFIGYSLINNTAGPITVIWTDGHDGSGDYIHGVIVPANDARNGGPPAGVSITEATYVTVTGGAILGTTYLGGVD